jgi:hypothetical protein
MTSRQPDDVTDQVGDDCLLKTFLPKEMNVMAKIKAASCRLAPSSIVVALTIAVTLVSAITSLAQTKPSDSEMKEVFRFLMEREVSRPADGNDVVVLLGPNVKAEWIPRISGFSIRQLDYDEEKQVAEYYDISWQLKGSVLEAQLVKGNYCRKAGRRYEFHRKSGVLDPKDVGFAEWNAGDGFCPGCAVGSADTYSVANQFPNPAKKKITTSRNANALRLTGEVKGISCARDKTYIRCKTDLRLTFANAGSTPAIILQPNGEYEFWHGGTTLALSENHSRNRSFVYMSSAWPSIYKFPLYRNLADLLDQPIPPARVTRTLRAGDSWSWATSIMVYLQERNSCNQHVGVQAGWQEIKALSSPLWLTVSYEMWPFNVENFKANLGGTLKQRWASYGNLYLEEKFGRYWHANLTSEPIELPLNRVELTQQ